MAYAPSQKTGVWLRPTGAVGLLRLSNRGLGAPNVDDTREPRPAVDRNANCLGYDKATLVRDWVHGGLAIDMGVG